MLFSILIPAYKRRFLAESIQSVIDQTMPDWELIIVDDASPEALQPVVEQFHSSRIRYYRNECNFGAVRVVDNWNRCLSYASGEYVLCMGDDDRLCPTCLEEFKRLIERYPGLSVYHGLTEVIDEDGQVVDFQEQRPEWESVYSMMWHRLLRGRRQFIGDFLFRTDDLKKQGGFYRLPLAWGSDDITAYRASAEKGIANVQNVVVFQYRVSSVTISKSADVLIKLEALSQERDWIGRFLEDCPSDALDRGYHGLLLRGVDKYYRMRVMDAIREDLNGAPLSRTFFWLAKKRAGIPLRYRIALILEAVIRRRFFLI